MAVDLSKVMDLADGLEIYKDLRDRIKNIPTPEVPVVGLLINGLVMPITENKYIKFGVQNGIQLTMGGAADATVFNLEADLRDVQIDGVSIRSQGIANIPRGNASQLGVFKINNSEGIGVYSDGRLCINEASSTQIKTGTTATKPIVPGNQHQSAFYGLAKAAGSDMKNSDNAVGTYTDEAKQAIQKMFGLDGILGDFESSAVASKAYAIGETFIYNGKRYRATAAIAISDVITPGTNCVLDPIDGKYIRNTDYAGYSIAGAVKIYSDYGIKILPSTGHLQTSPATSQDIKSASSSNFQSLYKPVTPYLQHEAAFFGLAKAANADMASLSDVMVGQYPQAQKTAIQTMLGIEADIPLIEEVSGSTPSITGMPNVRYICGTCSLLTITPPASGSIVVRFTSGSTPTVLTVPNTVKFPVWFDYTSLEADTTYEIIITDGVYGGVMSWAA